MPNYVIRNKNSKYIYDCSIDFGFSLTTLDDVDFADEEITSNTIEEAKIKFYNICGQSWTNARVNGFELERILLEDAEIFDLETFQHIEDIDGKAINFSIARSLLLDLRVHRSAFDDYIKTGKAERKYFEFTLLFNGLFSEAYQKLRDVLRNISITDNGWYLYRPSGSDVMYVQIAFDKVDQHVMFKLSSPFKIEESDEYEYPLEMIEEFEEDYKIKFKELV